MAIVAPSFNQIIPMGLGFQGGIEHLGLTPSSDVQWDYRPPADYDPVKAFEDFRGKNFNPASGFLKFGEIASGLTRPEYFERNPEYLIDPVTGLNPSGYRSYLQNELNSAIEAERKRTLDVNNFLKSPEGQKYILQQQYDLFRGNSPTGELVPTRKYVTDFDYGFNAPSGKYPYHGKKWQEDFTNYYNQFGGPQFGTDYGNATGETIFAGATGERMLSGLLGLGIHYASPYGFDKTFLKSIKKTDPQLYKFGTKWNEQVRAAQTWPDQLMSRYSLFADAVPEGYAAPEKHKTVKYGAKFGGEPGAKAIGKTNENPIPNTPGAGLWVYGIDPENPSDIAKAYNRMFGTDAKGNPMWYGPAELRQWAPKKAPDGSWQKANSLKDLYDFGAELDAYYRGLAQKIDLPKRGIMDSIAGKIILGGLTSAATGGLGSIVGGLTGSAAAGNLASLAANAAIGGAQGGLTGALTSGIGSAIGAGFDQAGGFSGIGDFASNPLGYIGSAYGIGGGAFSGLNLAGMGQAAQVGPGSLAQVTPPSSIGQNVLSTDYIGGIPHEVIEVVGDAGDVTQLGGGFGSSSGGAIGSALGGMLSGAGGAIGAPTLGGLSGIPSIRGTPGNLTGSLQTTASGMTPTAGTGTGGTGITTGTGGLTSGMPGPYSDASGQGLGESDLEDLKKFGITSLTLGMGGPWDFTGAGAGAGGTGASGAGIGVSGAPSGVAGLLDTGLGVGGAGAGGGGLGGDGTGGDGLGGDGLGSLSGGSSFPWGLLATGGQPGAIGDPASFITPRPIGAKKKGPGSFYGKLQEPKRRKGIRLRRA